MFTTRARALAGMTLMAAGLGLAAFGAGTANAAPGNQPPTGSYTWVCCTNR